MLSLSAMRLAEAKSLLQAGHFSGAYYLAGCAIEAALKARIAARFDADLIPDMAFVSDVYSHDLNRLCNLANLTGKLAEKSKASEAFRANWDTRDVGGRSQRTDSVDRVAQ